MLTLQSTVQEFLTVLHQYSVCSEPETWIGTVCSDPDAMRFGDLIALMVGDGSELTVNMDAWVVWLFTSIYAELDQACRDQFLSVLQDPMQCLILLRWCRVNVGLSDQDAAKLSEKYHGKLPNAETESD